MASKNCCYTRYQYSFEDTQLFSQLIQKIPLISGVTPIVASKFCGYHEFLMFGQKREGLLSPTFKAYISQRLISVYCNEKISC